MHKLKFHLEMLRVESFTTDFAGSAARGTVDAHAKPTQLATGCSIEPESQNCPATYNQADTCAYSCDGGCFPLTFTCES